MFNLPKEMSTGMSQHQETLEWFKSLSKKSQNEIIAAVDDNMIERIQFVYNYCLPHKDVDRIVEVINYTADEKNNPKLLIPFVLKYLEHENSKSRVLDCFEVTAFHFELMVPTNNIINTNKLLDCVYTQQLTSPCLLRAFLYWAGCLYLRRGDMVSAEKYMRWCSTSPCVLNKPSKIAVAACQKHVLLQTIVNKVY